MPDMCCKGKFSHILFNEHRRDLWISAIKGEEEEEEESIFEVKLGASSHGFALIML